MTQQVVGKFKSSASKARHAANVRWHGKDYKKKKSVSRRKSKTKPLSKKKSKPH